MVSKFFLACSIVFLRLFPGFSRGTPPFFGRFHRVHWRRGLEKDLSQVSQVLVTHAETAFATARRGSQLVAEAQFLWGCYGNMI
jgi:hypothetical protein